LTAFSLSTWKAKDTILSLVEGVWAFGFAIAGRFCRTPVNNWSSPGQQRVLVIAPHPDDEVVGCAGTIVQHKNCGDEVCIVYITDGRRSRALGLGPEEMACRRRQEAEAGAKSLGIDRFEWFGLPEGDWTAEQLQPPLQALMNQVAPHLIYAPSRIDFHPEHHKVATVLMTLLPDQPVELPAPLIRIYQSQVPLTPVLTNLVFDTSGVRRERAAAFTVYTTQLDNIGRALRQRRYAARFYGITQEAEEFWQMTAHQYCLLHCLPPDPWPVHTFRSLRSHSFSDPLAYLHGLSERRRFAGLVRQQSC